MWFINMLDVPTKLSMHGFVMRQAYCGIFLLPALYSGFIIQYSTLL